MTTASVIPPGCNMPCIPYSPESPGLWSYKVQATEKGLQAALLDRESDSDRFEHLVFFPTWSQGEIAYYWLSPGEQVVVEAAADDSLRVVDASGSGVEFPGKILVVAHVSLDAEALASYYSQEG